jgi:hypothetical protein
MTGGLVTDEWRDAAVVADELITHAVKALEALPEPQRWVMAEMVAGSIRQRAEAWHDEAQPTDKPRVR